MIPEKYEFIHPEEQLQLLNTDLIRAYPKYESAEDKAKRFEKERILLCKYAFFLWEQRTRILSDSRLFLTPVPIDNFIVSHTRHGSDKPTLGILVEWWAYAKEKVWQVDEQGQKWLIFEFQGHYLSGNNRCKAVNAAGELRKFRVDYFSSLFVPFLKIHKLYEEPQALYESYSFPQALELLLKDQ